MIDRDGGQLQARCEDEEDATRASGCGPGGSSPSNSGVVAAADRCGVPGGEGGNPTGGQGAIPGSLRVARPGPGGDAARDIRRARQIHRRRRGDGLPDALLGDPGGGITEVAAIQGAKSIQTQHPAAVGGGDCQYPARVPASWGRSPSSPLKLAFPGVRRRGRGGRLRSIEPPPWPGGRGEVHLSDKMRSHTSAPKFSDQIAKLVSGGRDGEIDGDGLRVVPLD